LDGTAATREQLQAILRADDDGLLGLLDAAFLIRRRHHGRRVQIHVLENAKKGACPEDCSFCSQSSRFASPSGTSDFKTADELVEGAERAVAQGARRYCMVTATRGPSQRDLEVICEATERIKAKYPVEVCASLGLLTAARAQRLKEAGVDRFNHNLETGPKHFEKVVTTHTFDDRLETLRAARDAGMDICSGGIVGLGESESDVIDLALELAALGADSVPVNFLDPRPGTPMGDRARLAPGYALKVLCAFRFAHPKADLRVAGGREVTLRSLQPMSLYAANSSFTSGYLTTGGNAASRDHQMIADLGFEIELMSEKSTESPRAQAAG